MDSSGFTAISTVDSAGNVWRLTADDTTRTATLYLNGEFYYETPLDE
jgi:hypothetical protein